MVGPASVRCCCNLQLSIFGCVVFTFLSLFVCDYNGCCHGLLSVGARYVVDIILIDLLGCSHSLFLNCLLLQYNVDLVLIMPLASVAHLRGVRIKLIWFMLLLNRLILLFVIDSYYSKILESCHALVIVHLEIGIVCLVIW